MGLLVTLKLQIQHRVHKLCNTTALRGRVDLKAPVYAFAFFSQASTWITWPSKAEPLRAATAASASSAVLYTAPPMPPFLISAYLQSPPCFMCSMSFLLRSTFFLLPPC